MTRFGFRNTRNDEEYGFLQYAEDAATRASAVKRINGRIGVLFRLLPGVYAIRDTTYCIPNRINSLSLVKTMRLPEPYFSLTNLDFRG